jgi:beta-lactamase class A
MFQKIFACNYPLRAVTVGLLFACGIIPAAAAEDAALAARLAPLIHKHEGQIAVAVKHLGDGRSFAHHADRPQATASLIKLPILVEAYRQAEAGKIDLNKLLTLREEDKTPGSGVLSTHFSAGARFTLRDALQLMIAVSDNTATNLVLGQIGLPSTNETMSSLGLPNTRIHALVFRPQTSIAPDRSKEFGLGSTTAGEMVQLLEMLYLGKLGKETSRSAMLDHLRACDDRTRISKLLPAGIKVAHKTGSVSAVRTAAGLIESPNGAIALCVLTQNNTDQRWSDENAANLLIAEIAKAAYDHFHPIAAKAPSDGVLRLGASGNQVQALQRTLNARGKPSPALALDGEFGPARKPPSKLFKNKLACPKLAKLRQKPGKRSVRWWKTSLLFQNQPL